MNPKPLQLPNVLIHCDWGSHPKKLWLARASLKDRTYTAYSPQPVGNLQDLIPSIRSQLAPNEAALIGFDFPIGLPVAYGDKTGFKSFPHFLLQLGKDKWSEFYEVCEKRSDIRLERPFYPNKPGGTRREHLSCALGLDDKQLYRACELQQKGRTAACPLFWTLGGNQAGKSAISGWKQVVSPAFSSNEISLWPFHGTLAELLTPGAIVVAETYPTQYHQRLFHQSLKGKRTQSNRVSVAYSWIARAEEWEIVLEEKLKSQICTGFPGEITSGSSSEYFSKRKDNQDDLLDAAIGLFGMLDTLRHYGPHFEPTDQKICAIEGWIFGQPRP